MTSWVAECQHVKEKEWLARRLHAIVTGGKVVTWGEAFLGGDSSLQRPDLSSGVKTVVPSLNAFSALKDDGSVVCWGMYPACEMSSTFEELQSGVVAIYSTDEAFAGVKADGSVVTWGHPDYGGSSSKKNSETASLSIIIPCVIAAVVLVAAVLFLIRKRTVAKTQHHRASMPAVTDETVVDAEA